MKYRSVGKSGLKISEVALGSWVTDLKGTTAEDAAKETVKLAYDSGVNFFDCADAYSGGAAERFLGKTLKQYPRKELVISSKVYFPHRRRRERPRPVPQAHFRKHRPDAEEHADRLSGHVLLPPF